MIGRTDALFFFGSFTSVTPPVLRSSHLPSSSSLETCHRRSAPSPPPPSIPGFSACSPPPHIPLPPFQASPRAPLPYASPLPMSQAPPSTPSPHPSPPLHGLLAAMSFLYPPSPSPDPPEPSLPSLITPPPWPARSDDAPLPPSAPHPTRRSPPSPRRSPPHTVAHGPPPGFWSVAPTRRVPPPSVLSSFEHSPSPPVTLPLHNLLATMLLLFPPNPSPDPPEPSLPHLSSPPPSGPHHPRLFRPSPPSATLPMLEFMELVHRLLTLLHGSHGGGRCDGGGGED